MEEVDELCFILRDLRCADKQLIVLGDFNMPNIDWNTYSSRSNDPISNRLLDAIFDLNLTQFVHEPTRLNNVLDLILSSYCDNIINVNVCELISDHQLVSADVVCKAKINGGPYKRVLDFVNGDYNAFNQYLHGINWYNLFTVNADVESRWIAFMDVINVGIARFIPSKCVRPTACNKYPVHIRRLVYKKRRKWARYKRNGDLHVLEDFKRLRKKLKCELRKWRTDCEHTVLNSGSVKRLYKYVNGKLHVPRSHVMLLDNNNDIMSDESAAEAFCKHFGSIYVNDDGNMPNFVNNVRAAFNDDLIDFSVVTIEKVISGLANTHSSGPDGFSSFLLKHLQYNISLPLSMLYFQSYNNGCIPEMWKRAVVCPVYKGSGSKTDVENYRPISLTCVCCKVMESVVSQSLLKYLQTNNLLTVAQHGFISKRSTLTAQLSCYNRWFKSIDCDRWVDVISLDFSKAFDTVSHCKLLHKLSKYGLSDSMLKWFKNFLSGRKQYVKVGDGVSTWIDVLSGVPQGSVCGPLLFNLYVNDIPECVSDCEMVLYADDSRLDIDSSIDNAAEVLARDLNNVAAWAARWQLKLNVMKSGIMHIGIHNPQAAYSVNDVDLPTVDKLKDLGLTVNNNLHFDLYIDSVVARAFRLCSCILNGFYTKSLGFMLKLYTTYVRPLLEYNTVVWSPQTLKYIDKCERVQRYFTKRLLGLWDVSYLDRLGRLKLESLEERRIQFDLICVFKIVHGLVNLPCDAFFVMSTSITRGHSFKLAKTFCKHTFAQHFFTYRVVNIWNSLPENVVCSKSLASFKSNLHACNLALHCKGGAFK
jgi:hypothetical protein